MRIGGDRMWGKSNFGTYTSRPSSGTGGTPESGITYYKSDSNNPWKVHRSWLIDQLSRLAGFLMTTRLCFSTDLLGGACTYMFLRFTSFSLHAPCCFSGNRRLFYERAPIKNQNNTRREEEEETAGIEEDSQRWYYFFLRPHFIFISYRGFAVYKCWYSQPHEVALNFTISARTTMAWKSTWLEYYLKPRMFILQRESILWHSNIALRI
jgi:hypothetical protein